MAAASARPRRRIRASPGSCALPLDIFIEHVLPYIPDATTLLSLAATNKALAARVRALPLAHIQKLVHGARRFQDVSVLRMPTLRALRVLTQTKCDVCGEGNVRSPFRVNWNLFAHDRCVRERCVNAFYLTEDTREKLLYAQAPFELQYLPVRGRNILAAYFWKQDDGVLPSHWTVEGVQYLTEDEAQDAGTDVPALETSERRAQAMQVLDSLNISRGPQFYFW